MKCQSCIHLQVLLLDGITSSRNREGLNNQKKRSKSEEIDEHTSEWSVDSIYK